MLGIDKSVGTINKELIVILQPEGSFELDWQVTEEKLDSSLISFQEEIYRRYIGNADEALLFLGFSELSLSNSESLRYLRLIASTFVKKLSINPDVELLREKIVVEIDEDEMNHLFESLPYLNGASNFNHNWIENAWGKLNHSFAKMIHTYKGSVEQFIVSMNPNIHLVGRIFFHLVESKKEDFPFAFLATYATKVSQDGKSKHLPLEKCTC